jgi:hypothetical protein
MQLGDFAYTWVRDGKGDMLWLDRITKAPKNVDPVELQVVAAWDLPAIADDQMLCLGWCSSPKGEPDATVVGLFDGSSNPLKLWRIDAKTPSMNVIPSAGWKLYGDVQEGEEALPMAERPELYGIVALASGEDRATYTALEQVSAGGGASFTPDTFLYPVEDFKENKRAVVLAQGTTVKDIVVTDYISSAEFSLGSSETPHLRYNGKPDGSLIAYISYSGPEKGKIHAAWRIDAATLKITTIDPSKVTEGNP